MFFFLLAVTLASVAAVYDNNNAICQEWKKAYTPPAPTNACVAPGSKGKCEQCMKDSDCESGRYCNGAWKKCIKSGDSCYGPYAGCSQRCSDQENPTLCPSCSHADFPNNWVSCNNDPNTFQYYGWDMDVPAIVYSREETSSGALAETDDFSQGAICNHNRLRAAGGLAPLTWDPCLGL
ncbi:uncharacterized protein LOC134855984 [Symsagittifera roscoffensis]|uniref:uncharacterized protein LOC134855984 n=1 Tax=Symsagittifera roscoffensis TaxID=84072 RepID=UPI00307CACAD